VIEGNDALGIGSLSGQAMIRSSGLLNITANCERATGIGSMTGTGEIRLEGGYASVTLHCDVGACIGSFSGEVSVLFSSTRVRIHGEGNRLAGFGSTDGACDTRIEAGYVEGNLLASSRRLLGNNHSRVIITGGNIRLFPEDGSTPVSPDGRALMLLNPEGDTFEKTFKDKRATWSYKAARSEDGFLGVWVPRS
jgi:hypothetical protein